MLCGRLGPAGCGRVHEWSTTTLSLLMSGIAVCMQFTLDAAASSAGMHIAVSVVVRVQIYSKCIILSGVSVVLSL